VKADGAARRGRRTRAPLELLLALCTIAGAPVAGAAQVNVEVLRPDDLPFGRSGTVQGDLAARKGNVDYVALDARAQLYNVRERSTRLIVASGGIGFLETSRFASAGLLHLRTTYTAFHERVAPEWLVQANYDRPLLLDFRLVAGAGGRGSFWRGAWGNVGGGSTLMLEHEWLSLPDTAEHASRTLEMRWSNFVSLKVVVSETTVITSTTYIQPALSDFGDYRVLEGAQLATSITDELALTVSFDLRYDSGPPDGLAALDARLRTGVTYRY
jgi:hypothetical protein